VHLPRRGESGQHRGMTKRKSRELIDLARNGYWGEEEGLRAVEAWRGSGLSQREFCKRSGLSAEKVGRWARRLATRPRMAELVVVDRHAEAGCTITIEIGAARIMIASGIDETELVKVVRAVVNAC